MAEPSDFEQLTLELINRFRADPTGEFERIFPLEGAETNVQNAVNFFGVDLNVLQSQLSSLSAQSPLAWNSELNDAATTHSQVMINFDQQSHLVTDAAGNAVEPSLSGRVDTAGYNNWQAIGENIFAFAEDAEHAQAAFIIDWGYDSVDRDASGNLFPDWQTRGDGIQDPPGHRNSLISSTFTEIGIGSINETNLNTQVGDVVITHNLGTRFDYEAQFVGVVIDDVDNDAFYDIGEGLGGVNVTATNGTATFTTVTWESGGYQLEVTPGTYTITFSGGALYNTITEVATIGNNNVKLDAISNEDAVATIGNDIIDGTADADQINGLAGNDTINGLEGADTLLGAEGNDTLNGGEGGDVLLGGAGIDTLNGDNGADFLAGGADKDIVNGGADGDSIFGEGGADILNGDGGVDAIFGGSEGDTINGGADGDALFGQTGDDTINGDAGIDLLFGEEGSDILSGGADDDVLFGDANAPIVGEGNDTLDGDGGGDSLFAGGGNDILFGGIGSDSLFGQDGNDTLSGGADLDALVGGAGADTFVFSQGFGSDFIIDFEDNVDTINLAGLGLTDANAALASGTAFQASNGVFFSFNGGDETLMVFGNTLTIADLADDILV